MSKLKCRVCLNDGAMISVFHEQDSVMLSTKITSVAKVQIHPEDGLPSTICRKCVKKLNNCLQFIQLCIESDTKLRSMNNYAEQDATTPDLDINLPNYPYNEDLGKLSPSSDTKDLLIDESMCETYTGDTKNEEITAPTGNCNTKSISDKKMQKQQCFTCGKVMSSRFRLKTHLRTHTGERPYTCPHCSKNFALAQNLKVHLRTHTGEKPLSCTECGAKFAHSAGLAVHRRKHTGQTPYGCEMCPRSFRTVGHLQYHIRRHTGEKNYECDACGRAFITRGDLKQHLLSHSGVKPHVCCICGLRVTRASHLKRHVQFVHNAERRFACTQCPSKFYQKGDFEKHKKKHDVKVDQ